MFRVLRNRLLTRLRIVRLRPDDTGWGSGAAATGVSHCGTLCSLSVFTSDASLAAARISDALLASWGDTLLAVAACKFAHICFLIQLGQ